MNLYLNCDKTETSFTKRDYLLRAASRLGLTNVLPYEKGEVECVLNIEPFPKFVRGSRWTGIWEIDLLLDRAEANLSNWMTADKVYLAISDYPDRLQPAAEKTELLFQAVDPTVHRRIEGVPQEYDFVTCGTIGLEIYNERERLIKLLSQHFSHMNYGKGHAPHKYIENLNHAKVQFIRSMKTKIADGEIAQRFFECLAIGPVLTNYVPDLKHTGLVEDVDYLSYCCDEELLEKMRKLVDNRDYANYIAENGRKKAQELHLFEHRLQRILKEVEKYERPVSK